MSDLGFSGSPFTWCNGQSGCARWWARLDRFLANVEWMDFFDSYSVAHLQRISLDHSPLFWKTKLRSLSKRKIFHFENIWFDHKGCHDSVAKAWNFQPNSSPLHSFAHLISRTKHLLITWKKSGLSPLDVEIQKAESDIEFLENMDSGTNPYSLDS